MRTPWTSIKIWSILDVFMAIGVIVSLMVGYHLKRVTEGSGGDGVSRACLEANVLLYLAAFLSMWFLWNWFDDLVAGDAGQSDLRLTFWGFIDPLYVLVACAAGRRLLRSGSE